MGDLAALEAPRKLNAWLVEFLVQDGLAAGGTPYRFTDSTSDATDEEGNTYTSVPSLEVRLPPMTGVLDNKPCAIEAPTGAHAFFSRVAQDAPCPVVTVNVREQITAYAGDTAYAGLAFEAYHFHGRMSETVRNANGRSDSVRIEAVSLKGRMGVPLGVPATPECQWIFRQAPCGADAAAELQEQTTYVTAIDGTELTTTGIGRPTLGDNLYERGYVLNEIDGVTIDIRIWARATATRVVLVEPPPATWLGQLVRLMPGCRGTTADCAMWGQTGKFGGMGIKIPNYHPVYEIPGATA